MGKCGGKGKYLQTQDVVIKYLTSVLLLLTPDLLGLSFLSYTKLDLICRSKYCCSKSINLGTKFAGHSCMKSSKGELLHRSVRLERELIDQVN